MAKRKRFDFANKFESSEDSDDTCENQVAESSDPDIDVQKFQSRRKPKCFSKSAEMARQNRLKKKIQLAKLEKKVEILKKEKNDLVGLIDSQSVLLSDLRKEVRYLKGIVANSSDIRKLVKNIHESTGMPVSSSLNSTSKVCTNDTSEESWRLLVKDDNNKLSDCLSYDYLFDDIRSVDLEETHPLPPTLQEHNYTSNLGNEDYGDYGICLHVCKNKVSLEFCSVCEENAKSGNLMY